MPADIETIEEYCVTTPELEEAIAMMLAYEAECFSLPIVRFRLAAPIWNSPAQALELD